MLAIVIFGTLTIYVDADFKGLVPEGCQAGCPCTLCDLYELGANIIDFGLKYLAIPIVAAMLLWGGFLMLTSGGNPNRISEGKKVIVNSIAGLALAFFGWVIINTLLQTFAFKVNFRSAALNWFERPHCPEIAAGRQCALAENLQDIETPAYDLLDAFVTLEDGRTLQTNDGYAIDPTNAAQQRLLNPPTGEGGAFSSSSGQDTSAPLTAYNNLVLQAASKYGVSPTTIKAIIATESGGNPSAYNPENDGRGAYGLMQIRTDTARALEPKTFGSLSDAEIIAALQNPETNIRVGTKYYAGLLQKYGDPTLAAAGYNGGPGANLPSRNCAGQRRWQCGWDNNEHSIPNEGYLVTRGYVQKIKNNEEFYQSNPDA